MIIGIIRTWDKAISRCSRRAPEESRRIEWDYYEQ